MAVAVVVVAIGIVDKNIGVRAFEENCRRKISNFQNKYQLNSTEISDCGTAKSFFSYKNNIN